MKDFKKIMIMLIIGLLVAIVIYPFIHESGHSIAALMVGGEVIEYHLFPLPNVLCNVGSVTTMGKVVIGIGGMLFPIVVTTIIIHPHKRFWTWYANLIMRGICVLSVVISTVATFFYAAGNPIANEDITTVLNIAPNLIGAVAIASLLMLDTLIIIIAKDKPIKKIGDYLLN